MINNLFRPFTKHDWMAYAGCESAVPFILHSATVVLEGKRTEADVIIDGHGVSINTEDACWGAEFKSQELAIAVATAIVVNGLAVDSALERLN